MADTPDRAPPPPWDISGMVTRRCDVANASGTATGVVLHLGQREQRAGGEAGVRLLHQLTLTPYSAKRLQELLAVLVREHDRRRGAG